MTAQVLGGRATAAAMKKDLADRVTRLAEHGIVPGLGTVLVGDDPGSRSYVAGKHRDCAEVGVASLRRDLPETITEEQLMSVLDELNGDPACTGYIVQLPLPAHIDTQRVLERIDPAAKDADGLHPVNLGRLVASVSGELESSLPCTPAGCVELLRHHGIDLDGRPPGRDPRRRRHHRRGRIDPHGAQGRRETGGHRPGRRCLADGR